MMKTWYTILCILWNDTIIMEGIFLFSFFFWWESRQFLEIWQGNKTITTHHQNQEEATKLLVERREKRLIFVGTQTNSSHISMHRLCISFGLPMNLQLVSPLSDKLSEKGSMQHWILIMHYSRMSILLLLLVNDLQQHYQILYWLLWT